MTFYLSIIGIGLLTLLLSVFIKKKITLLFVTGCIVLGVMFIYDQLKYTSFTDLYSRQINEESELEYVEITLYELVNEYPERYKYLTIEDDDIMEEILSDFSKVRLKKDFSLDRFYKDEKYSIDFLVTNKVKENMYQTEIVTLYLYDGHLNDYKIVSDTNYLKTIEALIGNEEYNWREYN